jgi:hypothetical protein
MDTAIAELRAWPTSEETAAPAQPLEERHLLALRLASLTQRKFRAARIAPRGCEDLDQPLPACAAYSEVPSTYIA